MRKLAAAIGVLRQALTGRRALGVGVGLLAVALVSGSTAEAADCKTVRGKGTLNAVTGPACTSPVGLCVSAVLTGGLSGHVLSTVTSIIPTADTPTTSVVFLTADTVITTDKGTLSQKEAVAFQTSGPGEFSELDIVVAGTGEWAGATGVFRADGTFDGSTGVNEYTAEICGS
jgi:hypothetical protein